MAKNLVIVDTCVFIKAFRNDLQAKSDLKKIEGSTAYSVITDLAVQLMLKYISGQKIISVPDCLIAASSIVTGLPLLTYNKKDFDFIEGIQLY